MRISEERRAFNFLARWMTPSQQAVTRSPKSLASIDGADTRKRGLPAAASNAGQGGLAKPLPKSSSGSGRRMATNMHEPAVDPSIFSNVGPCVNVIDLITQEPLDSVPRHRFIRTDDGYGHDGLALARFLSTRVANPATGLPLTYADVSRLRCIKGASSLLKRASASQRGRACQNMAESEFEKALENIDQLQLLQKNPLNAAILRIDCLVNLGRHGEARAVANEFAHVLRESWELRIRTMALNAAAGSPIAGFELPPLKAMARDIAWAAIICSKCDCHAQAVRLSRLALDCSPGNQADFKHACAEIEWTARNAEVRPTS